MNVIHPSCHISSQAVIGPNTRIWLNVQVRENAHIGANCNIGKDVYIDKNVIIGNGVKIQNGVSIYAGVTIEDDVFIGPHVVFTNDMYPRAFSIDWTIFPTLVKRGASIGANSTVICGITIGEYAMVGAGTVVSRDVTTFTLVTGNPASLVDHVCKCGIPLKKHPGQKHCST